MKDISFLKPTPLYDFYWKFAAERQCIFMKRLRNKFAPWTNDEILKKYKFTNVYRACDRVSQYLIKNIIYEKIYSEEDIIFRILLFKIFNSIETWKILEKHLGEISYKKFSIKVYSDILQHEFSKKHKLYSGAYIMPSAKNVFGQDRKYANHLFLLEYMMKDKFCLKLSSCTTLKDVYKLLLSYPSLGSFLAFQYTIDLNYSEVLNFSEMDYVVAGPGALSGIKKCFYNYNEVNTENIIQFVSENQEKEFTRLGLKFDYLGNRKLQLIDCQNIFCEFDKYSRVKFPDVKGLYKRNKIKRKFTINEERIEYFFPPKWKILL